LYRVPPMWPAYAELPIMMVYTKSLVEPVQGELIQPAPASSNVTNSTDRLVPVNAVEDVILEIRLPM